MNGHTPGPWEVIEPFVSTGEYVKIIGGIDGDADDDGRPYMISTHVCDVIDNQEEQANAKLIAAAPALLALAKQFASDCLECDGTGRAPTIDAAGKPAGAVDCEACADIRAEIAKATGAAP